MIEKLLKRLQEKKAEAMEDQLMSRSLGHKERVEYWKGVIGGLEFAIANAERIAEEEDAEMKGLRKRIAANPNRNGGR